MNWTLLQNSLLVASLATLGSSVAGGLAALCVGSMNVRCRRWALMAGAVVLVMPPFLVTSCWLNLLGHTGEWKDWLPLNIYSLWGTVWILMLLTWPITLFFVWADWERLSQQHLESDPALRGGALIRWLLIPLARSGLAHAALLTFVLTLNNFAVPAILQTKVYPAEVWVNFNTTLDYAAAIQIGWPLFVAPLLFVVWLARRNFEWSGFEGSIPAALFRRHLGGRWLTLSAVGTALMFGLSLLLPLRDMLLSQRTWVELPAALAAGKSAVGNSLLFSFLGATGCVLTGLLMARSKWPVMLWVSFLLPGILIGIGLGFAFNRSFLSMIYQSAAIVLIGLVVRYVAIAWQGARHALNSMDPDLTATAKLNDRARYPQLFRHVFWPQIGPQLIAIWYVVYLFCLWDVETLIFVIPPGRETLALRIFNLLHYGHNAQVNALCLLLVALAGAPLLMWFVSRWAHALWGRRGIALGFLLMAMAGCAPATGPNQSAIQSRFFGKVQIIGSRGTALGQFNKPRSLTVDAQDNLYVVDMTGRVQKFSPEGSFVRSWQMPETDLGKPKGMARDIDGNIIVIEPHYARVNHFSPDGRLVRQWGVHGTNGGELTLPRAVAVTPKGELYISEYTQAERVQKFSEQGRQFRLAFGRAGNQPGEFNRPEGLAVDPDGRLYVADSCNHRIQIFSPDGQWLASYGKPGDGLGELSYPYDIQVDEAGWQYVCEFGNSRVQIFDAQNQPVEVLGGMGSEPGQLSNPWSLALDSKGNLYIADSRNHRVQKFIRRKDARVAGRREGSAENS